MVLTMEGRRYLATARIFCIRYSLKSKTQDCSDSFNQRSTLTTSPRSPPCLLSLISLIFDSVFGFHDLPSSPTYAVSFTTHHISNSQLTSQASLIYLTACRIHTLPSNPSPCVCSCLSLFNFSLGSDISLFSFPSSHRFPNSKYVTFY